MEGWSRIWNSLHAAGGRSQTENSKSEYRNPKQIQNPNVSMAKTEEQEISFIADSMRITSFCHFYCISVIRICFVLGGSDFGFRTWCVPYACYTPKLSWGGQQQ